MSLPALTPFDVHGEGDVAQRFNNCVDKLKNLFMGANIKDNKRQRGLMLNYAGDGV